MLRIVAGLGVVLLVSACASATADLREPVEPLGDFRLGLSEVVAPNLQKLLVSKDATAEEWTAAMDGALETRFGRFSGDKFYNLGVSVEAYSLPPALVPGRSALAVRVTIWDDAARAKLNAEPEVFNVIKVFETRLGLTREAQIKGLAEEAARQVEDWARRMQAEEGWFGGIPAETGATAEPAPEAG